MPDPVRVTFPRRRNPEGRPLRD